MREAGAPSAEGQRLLVEDRGGERWQVDCLGEPVEVGARVVFEPLAVTGARSRGLPRRGVLVRVDEERRREWICTLRREGGQWQLVAFGGLSLRDVTLSDRDCRGAEDGDRVRIVEATPSKARGGRGSRVRRRRRVRVAEILGRPGDPDADYRAVVWKHRLVERFPRRARLEAEASQEEIPSAEIEGRLDLRHLPFVTIDPATARDHDDAIYAEARREESLAAVDDQGKPRSRKASPTWQRRLWVAIADVAHYVEAGSALDAEARRRGNSVYFPDRAIPMLPERLSSGLCSLRPEVDRLAMVVELRLAANGTVADALFHEAVIRSHARLSYEEAASWLGSGGSDVEPVPIWGESLRCLEAISAGLHDERRRAGAIFLDLPEIEIEYDNEGRPVDAVVRERNPAHGLIEEAMLAANRAVAAALDRAGRSVIHRVHPPPSPAKLEALADLLDRHALRENADLETPGALAPILERVRGGPLEERIHTAALRSMSQARYEAESRGHYALRFAHYLHFTSPIRRYADLVVHRALKRWLCGEGGEKAAESRREEVDRQLGIWLSGRERLAIEAERDAAALACCAILQGREGERFRARVGAATEFGLFVRLESPAASGLVPIGTMEGEWFFEPEEEVLIRGGAKTRIGAGEDIDVRLAEVDMDRGRLAFRILREPAESSRVKDSRRPSR